MLLHTLSNLTPDCYFKVVQEYERAVIFRLGRSWHLNHDDVQYIIKIAISWNQRLKTDLNKVHKVCHHCFFDVTNLVLVSPQDSNGIRLRSGGAKGPGLFFIVPCIDQYRCTVCHFYFDLFGKQNTCDVIMNLLSSSSRSTLTHIRIIHLGSSRQIRWQRQSQRQRQRMTVLIRCVDLRTGAFDVPPQEILTRSDI